MARKNYSKMSTQEAKAPEVEQTPVVEETAVETEVSEPKILPVGIVAGCNKLNIRKGPNASAEILCEAAIKSELTIDLDKSTDEWYSVCTPAGIDGFCMKKFVEINE